MSLKWYAGAVLDETQEAYGKTWRVDRIENDGAIVFRCGKETAVAPRTDQELINPCKKIDVNLQGSDFTVTGEVVGYFPYAPSQIIQSVGPVRTPEQTAKILGIMADTFPMFVHDEVDLDIMRGLPAGALFTDRTIVWHRALAETEIRQAQDWVTRTWSKHYTLNCTLSRDGVEGMTVVEKMKGEP